MKAIVSCLCGKTHELEAEQSTRCSCGRVVLLEPYMLTATGVRPWVDENGVDYPGSFDAPEVVGWKFEKKARR